MFIEDLIADISINAFRLLLVVIAALITVYRARQTGKFDFVPAAVAVALSFVLGFIQPMLADFIYLNFIR